MLVSKFFGVEKRLELCPGVRSFPRRFWFDEKTDDKQVQSKPKRIVSIYQPSHHDSPRLSPQSPQAPSRRIVKTSDTCLPVTH